MMIREREKKREREKSKHRNALLAYHGSGPGHPVPSPSRDRLHFPQVRLRRVPSRIRKSIIRMCVYKEQKRVNFVRVFRAEFSLKSRDKKGGTLHSFEYSTTTTIVK